jgi:glutathione S-transferase
VPPLARGFVRDLRVRWALEEIGLPYSVRLIGGAGGTPFGTPRPENYLAEQPFGQVPVYKEGTLCLFESGAIVLHIGEKDERLLPRDEHGRARAIVWTVAALNSVEPQSLAMFFLNISCGEKPWFAEAQAAVAPFLERRLTHLAAALGENEWLEERFTIGDLMMVEALRSIPNEVLAVHPNLTAYVSRGTARPAFRRAREAQLADFVPDQADA